MKKKQIFKRALRRMAPLMFAIAIVASMFALNTAAVSYNGSGTKQDPYIVETAEQLDGMRNNLSAHYKLGNTIDMSSFGTFTPIGWQGSAFTGSFVCDTNEDGTPKYAIKNLKVYNDSGEKFGHKPGTNAGYVDFKQGKCKWQAGLFGWTQGATLTNIAVLSADVTNTVVGQNNMNKDWSLNPGQGEEQGTGILAGVAEDSTIMGCVSSGKVNSSSNATGGLIGRSNGGTSIAYCYSTATVTNSGYWNTGGLIGSCGGSMSCCFATGDVKGGATEPTTGSLCGGIDATSTLSSCYATGEVLSDSNGHNFVGFDNGKDVPDGMYYCYFTGSVKGYSSFDNAGTTASEQSLYALKGAAGRQAGFTEATAKEIKEKFSSSSDWDVSGDLPTLKQIKVIKDEGKYVPTKADDNAQNSSSQSSSSSQVADSKPNESSSQSGIGTQSKPTDNNSSTANSSSNNASTPTNNTQGTSSQQGGASEDASNTSSQPTGNTQSQNSSVTSSETSGAVGDNSSQSTQSSSMDVSTLIEKINALPIEDDITIENYPAIKEIRVAYENLSDDQLGELTIEAITKYNVSLSAIIPCVMTDITKQVNELPEVEKLTSKDYETVMALKEKLEFIGENAEFMEETVTEKLSAAIEKMQEIGNQTESGTSAESASISTVEWILIGVICLFIVCALTVEVIWTYSVVKKMKALNQDEEDQE